MAKDSRIIEKIQSTCAGVSQLTIANHVRTQRVYLDEPGRIPFKHHLQYWRGDGTPAKDDSRDLPFTLLLARPRIYPQHQKQDIETTADVEQLEYDVIDDIIPQEVDIARAEDQGIQ